MRSREWAGRPPRRYARSRDQTVRQVATTRVTAEPVTASPQRLGDAIDDPVLEGWTVLAGLAAVTNRIRLATLVTALSYRNPAHLAKIAASVDLISRGRLTLSISAGFLEDEYKQYGWVSRCRLDGE